MGIMDRIKEEASSAVSSSFNVSSQQGEQPVQQGQAVQPVQQRRIPHYVVLQVTLKEKLIGTGSGNLSELERVINSQAGKGYRLHTISTAAGGSKGIASGDRIQATLVFEQIV